MSCCNNIYPESDLRRWESCDSVQLANADNYYTKKEVDDLLDDIVVSGDGITADEAQDLIDSSLSDYYTKEEIDAGFDTVNNELTKKLDASAYTPTDLSQYWTSAETAAVIEDNEYVISQAINELKYTKQDALVSGENIKTINGISLVGEGDIQIGSGGTTDLSNYYNKQETNNLLDNKLDASAYTPTDLSGYWTSGETQDAINAATSGIPSSATIEGLRSDVNALSGEVQDKADKSEIPSLNGYATEQWVQNQGYLTQHQSLSGYATEQWVQNQGYLTQHQSLSGYATEQWVQNQGYLTQHQSLDNYYSKSQVDALISGLQAQIDELTTALSECCTGQTGETQARIGAVIYSSAANAIMDVGSSGEIERIVIESGGTYYPSAVGNDTFPMPKAGNNRANIYLVNGTTTLGATSKWRSSAVNYNFSGATDVTRIGQNCFKDSPYLQTLTLPSSVASIADHAFDNCPSLARLNILAETPPTLEYYSEGYDAIKTLMTDNANVVVYVPSTALTAYRSATGWSAYSSRIQAIQ